MLHDDHVKIWFETGMATHDKNCGCHGHVLYAATREIMIHRIMLRKFLTEKEIEEEYSKAQMEWLATHRENKG